MPRPPFPKKVQEAKPSRLVRFRIAVLNNPAASRVYQHGVIREDPVAVARAPYTAMFLNLPEAEAQARLDEGCRFAGAGRPDHHIPGQLIEPASVPLPAKRAVLEFVQRLHKQTVEFFQLGRACRFPRR